MLYSRAALAEAVVCQLLEVDADDFDCMAHVQVLMLALRKYGYLLRRCGPVDLKRVFEIVHRRAVELLKRHEEEATLTKDSVESRRDGDG